MDALGHTTLAWRLRRPCRLRPWQLLGWSCLGPLLALLPAMGFLAAGFPWVLGFVLLVAVGLAAAVLGYGVHALDGEDVQLRDGRVRITCVCGSRHQVHEWPADRVRVMPSPAQDLELQLDGRAVLRLGGCVDATAQRRFLVELRRALADERARG